MEELSQEEKSKEYISNLLASSYKENAYGRLQELYDLIKNSDLNTINSKEEKELFFDIDRISDEVKAYAMRTKLQAWKLEDIYRMLAEINKVKNNIDSITKEEYYKYKNAFDFELKAENPQNQKKVKYVKRAFEIEKKINEACKVTTEITNEIYFKNFFKEGVANNLINEIKEEFTPIKPKETAILIYLLHKENKIINLNNRKFKGRKKLSEILLNKVISNNESVNKYFESGTDNINIHKLTDPNFKNIKERLDKIIESLKIH